MKITPIDLMIITCSMGLLLAGWNLGGHYRDIEEVICLEHKQTKTRAKLVSQRPFFVQWDSGDKSESKPENWVVVECGK